MDSVWRDSEFLRGGWDGLDYRRPRTQFDTGDKTPTKSLRIKSTYGLTFIPLLRLLKFVPVFPRWTGFRERRFSFAVGWPASAP